ncbi:MULTISPECIES: hypothetical protein [Actinoalloteichus]|uniref:hypothetical protein n=1 Tax=Actinoalloteichus TaxID=65496 RepID=UPI0018DB6B41|nr:MULTISPECIES: hypothetical protein [Actinoalloteichus]
MQLTAAGHTLAEEAPIAPAAVEQAVAVLEDRDRFACRHVVTGSVGGNVDLDADHRWVRR